MTSGAGSASAAARATYVVFTGSGFGFASWASRIPQVKAALGLSPSAVGLVLLAIAGGALVSMPLAGPIIGRIGSRRTVAAMSLVETAGLLGVALGYRHGVAVLVLALAVLGFGNGAWDVAMNVQGAAVEQALGRAIMPRFHAGFSIGTVAGALLGAAAIACHVSVTAHLALAAGLVLLGVPQATRAFLPEHHRHSAERAGAGDSARGRPAWTELRTLLVGLFVLCFAFAEGTGNDWISVALIDDHGTAPAVGTLCFALFLAAMTGGRWFGPMLLDRHGRVLVSRLLAGVGAAGALLFALGSTPLAFVGAVAWGIGASLGFPIGMSAGADDPARSAARVSVISSIGYCAFLAGPPVIGFLGQHLTVARALAAAAVLLGLAALMAACVRPLAPVGQPAVAGGEPARDGSSVERG